MHASNNRHVRVMLDHGTQLGLMATTAQLIEDDTGDFYRGIESLVTKDQWCNAPSHATGIEDQDHRCAGECCQRRIAVTAVQVEAVIQTLVALDQADVGIQRVLAHGGQDLLVGHAVEIQIVTGAAGRLAEPHGINVIRAFLERLYDQTTFCECRAQTQGNGGFSRGLVGCRYQQT